MMKLFKKGKKASRYQWRPAIDMHDRSVVNILINPIG